MLLQELATRNRPTTHAELTEKLSPSGVDRVTIYRTLMSLVEYGVLLRIQIGDRLWRYDLPRTTRSSHATHAHFVCTDCQRIQCLAQNVVSVRKLADGSVVDEIQLRGRCCDCAKNTQ